MVRPLFAASGGRAATRAPRWQTAQQFRVPQSQGHTVHRAETLSRMRGLEGVPYERGAMGTDNARMPRRSSGFAWTRARNRMYTRCVALRPNVLLFASTSGTCLESAIGRWIWCVPIEGLRVAGGRGAAIGRWMWSIPIPVLGGLVAKRRTVPNVSRAVRSWRMGRGKKYSKRPLPFTWVLLGASGPWPTENSRNRWTSWTWPALSSCPSSSRA
eukprot:205728-Prorocentrum_minimum.AAC.3